MNRSADIRARLGHPIIDVDGHILEYRKIVLDYMEDLFGAKMRQDFLAWDEQARQHHWDNASPADRLNLRMGRPQFWATAARNTLDRATAVFPALRRARMDEAGIDFSILYPSAGLLYVNLPNDQFRPALCRAYNTMVADLFRDHSDRMTPVAIIPTFTPAEAIEELDHAVSRLGLKAVKLANFVIRTVPAADGATPEIARAAQWYDMLALDSLYDTIRSGPSALSWVSRSPPTIPPLGWACGVRSATSCSTIAVISPLAAKCSRRRCFLVASPRVSPT
jgi:hypothetical protein